MATGGLKKGKRVLICYGEPFFLRYAIVRHSARWKDQCKKTVSVFLLAPMVIPNFYFQYFPADGSVLSESECK